MSREELLAVTMRLENAEPDARKGLWLLAVTRSPDYPLVGDEWQEILIVEAVTGPGAVAVAATLDLMPADPGDITLSGPHPRDMWPRSWWYRWLDEASVAQMEAELRGSST